MRIRIMKTAMLAMLLAVTLLAQTNTWLKVTGREVGTWDFPAMVYSTSTDEFVLSLGWHVGAYSVTVYTHRLGKWINALPHDSLYGSATTANSVDSAAGNWADSTGVPYGLGNGQGNGYFGWGFHWMNIKGYLRPNPNPDLKNSRAYGQFCYNSDNGKIYYYVNNWTFSYDPATRLWDTLSPASHPTSNGSTDFLKWGSLCYDAYNHEVVLFGGGGVDKPNGSPGTWTYYPATNAWTERNIGAQPTARAHSPMAYDPVNHKILLFGGDHLDRLLNDTWVYDCVSRSWSKKTPAISPKPRAGHAMIYLPKSGKIVLLGGYRYDNLMQWESGTTDFEIWTYDIASNAWGLVKRMVSPQIWPQTWITFPPLCGLMAADKGDTILALNDTSIGYHLNPGTMRMACDASVIDAQNTALYGVSRDTVALRGGWNNPAYWTALPAQDTAAHENNLRTLPPGTWTKINPPETMPGDRTWGSAVLDPSRDLFMRWGGGHAAYCGTDVPQYSLHENRWAIGYPPEGALEYNGNNEPSPGPFTFNDRPFMPTHPVKSTAFDPTSRYMIHFTMQYTYLYNPDSMDWVKGVRILSPVQSSNGMATYYAGLVSTPHGVFGNWASGNFLFNSDSLKWRRLPATGVTLPGYFADACGTVYDSKRDRILYVYQGYGNITTPARLYDYDFATGVASKLTPADSALATGSTNYRDAVYVASLDIVLFPIRQSSSNLAYDCANNRWFQVPVAGFVTGMDDVGTAMMYDAKRDRVWLTDNRSNVYALRLDSAMLRAELSPADYKTKNLTLSPNPFTPTTAISLPEWNRGAAGKVSLRVFAVDGRCVADLSRQAAAGNKVLWQAPALPAGIYVIKYAAGNKVWRIKAALVR